MRDHRIELHLAQGGIFDADVVGDLSVAGLNDLLVEDALGLAARKGEPVILAGRIADGPTSITVIRSEVPGIIGEVVLADRRQGTPNQDLGIAFR